MTEQAIAELLKQGILGALLVITGYIAYRKDKEVSDTRTKYDALQEKRLEDAVNNKKEMLEITNKVNEVILQLTSLFNNSGRKKR